MGAGLLAVQQLGSLSESRANAARRAGGPGTYHDRPKLPEAPM